jgi:threonylcarbamoyladenosine tRNA methylthiotransferase CDKAL1
MKIYVETYGCAANKADENIIKTILKKENFVDHAYRADMIILLSCGVKGSTENKIMDRIKEMHDVKVIIGGCLPKMLEEKMRKTFPKYSLIGPDQIADIASIFERVKSGEVVVELSEKKCKHVSADVKAETQAISICSGCLGNCAYCATKLAKGHLKSYSIEEIVDSVKKAVENSAKKILLTAQDTGVYGQDIGTNLPELLQAVLEIPGNFKVRLGMMNPKFAIKYADELISLYKDKKMIKFLHIPVQSGSNAVLKSMNRNYTVEEFEDIVKKMRKGIPKLVFSTDVICGFPGETDSQFEETVSLIKRIRPNMLNLSKFYPRPGTEAMKMDIIYNRAVKDRSTKLFHIFQDIRKI